MKYSKSELLKIRQEKRMKLYGFSWVTIGNREYKRRNLKYKPVNNEYD